MPTRARRERIFSSRISAVAETTMLLSYRGTLCGALTLSSSRMRLRLMAASCFLASSAQIMLAADPGLLNLAMPNARVMAGINVEQARLSPFGQYLMAGIAEREAGLQTLIDATGFDPRRDLHEVLFASTGENGGGTALVAARGTFHVAKIMEATLSQGQTAETYKGVEILSDK